MAEEGEEGVWSTRCLPIHPSLVKSSTKVAKTVVSRRNSRDYFVNTVGVVNVTSKGTTFVNGCFVCKREVSFVTTTTLRRRVWVRRV